MVTATLSMFTIGITPSLEIFAEEQAQQQKVSVLKNDTIQKIAALGYPNLMAEIWKSTDSNPIKPDTPNSSNILEGSQFAWSLKGIGDFEFAKVNLNKSTEEMQIDLKAGVPHNYFDSTYASIKVQNTSGKVVYNKEIYGNKQHNAEQAKIPVKVGDFIEFTHFEGANRATITNMKKKHS